MSALLTGGLAFPPRALALGGLSPAGAALSFRGSVEAALAGSAAVAAVTANVKALRVSEAQAVPAVLYQVVSLPRGHNLAGPDGVARARVRLYLLSASLDDGRALAAACRGLLDGFAGKLGGPAGVAAVESFLVDEADRYEPPADASDRGTRVTRQEYVIRFREPANPANVHD